MILLRSHKNILLFIALFIYQNLFAAEPAFDLRLTNRNYISSDEGYFDITIRQTNPEVIDFLYSSGQYVIILDTAFQSEHLNYIYTIDTSTYGLRRIPPQYTGPVTKVNNILKIAYGDPIPAGDEPLIRGDSATVIARIRFYNPDLYSGSCLLEEQFFWKTQSPGDFTKVFFRKDNNTHQINNNNSGFSTADLCLSSFCCLEAPLPPPLRLSPENNSTGLSYPVSLIWEKGFPVNYSAHLQVAFDSSFNKIIYEQSLTSPDGQGNVKVELDSVRTPGTYYWRVKQGGIPPQGAYNEPWKFTMVPGPITLKLTAIPEGPFRSGVNSPGLIVYLRENSAPFLIVDSCIINLQDSTYESILNFENAESGSYYIVVRSANTLETWSREGGEYLERGSMVNEYDFSVNDSLAYCSNEILVRDKYCLYSGDVNQDGSINLIDMENIDPDMINFVTGINSSDVTGDGVTDLSDILIAGNNSLNYISACSPLTGMISY